MRVESMEKGTANPQRPRSGNRLYDRNLNTYSNQLSLAQSKNDVDATHRTLVQRLTVLPIRKLGRGLSKLRQTGDGEVLLIRLRASEELFSGSDALQHKRLAVLIAVRANTEVNFA